MIRSIDRIQSRSAVLDVLHRLEAMGVHRVDPLDPEPRQLRIALKSLRRLGVGRALTEGSIGTDDGSLERLAHELEFIPVPQTEWTAVRETLGLDLLADLVGASVSSIRRYEAGDRKTPDDVAARLHFLAMCNADLGGSYNEWGVRRWYERPRSPLEGRSPRAVLAGSWDPDDAEPVAVRRLAHALSGAGAAA